MSDHTAELCALVTAEAVAAAAGIETARAMCRTARTEAIRRLRTLEAANGLLALHDRPLVPVPEDALSEIGFRRRRPPAAAAAGDERSDG